MGQKNMPIEEIKKDKLIIVKFKQTEFKFLVDKVKEKKIYGKLIFDHERPSAINENFEADYNNPRLTLREASLNEKTNAILKLEKVPEQTSLVQETIERLSKQK